MVGRLDLAHKIFDDRRVIQVATLRDGCHQQMMFDERPQGVRGGAVQAQTFGRAHGHPGADQRMGNFPAVLGFAHVVEEQCQIEEFGSLQSLKQRRIILVRRLLRFPNFIQLLQANQRMLIGGVLMIKLVLHQTGQPAEFGKVFAEQVDLVHRPQNPRHLAPMFQYRQERLTHVLIHQKIPVHQRKLIANQLGQVGMQGHAPLLRVKENTHEPPR